MSQEQLALALQNLELKLGYAFADPELLVHALTHRSFGPEHNERLEFLGDSILGVIIAKQLFDRFPQVPEGDLTRMRSTLVRETTLAELAREKGIGNCLRLGPGELKTGGFRRQSLIADAVEAIIGAMFLDSGGDYERVRAVVESWFESRLAHIEPGESQKDHKTALQEYLQARHEPLPVYTVSNISGADNEPLFEVKASIGRLPPFVGKGTSKRRAEQQAAGRALEYLQKEGAH
ncbi:MAG: ribonuclease III [Succinivibrio sp.]|nr:ribonuclease III [Succinivibrio sp.]